MNRCDIKRQQLIVRYYNFFNPKARVENILEIPAQQRNTLLEMPNKTLAFPFIRKALLRKSNSNRHSPFSIGYDELAKKYCITVYEVKKIGRALGVYNALRNKKNSI